jgi:hypothetical protein
MHADDPLPEQFDIREIYAAQDEALSAAGWNDPAMDACDNYDAHRPPQ